MKTFIIKNFSKEFKKFKTAYLYYSPEWFWRDGERILTSKEKKYKQIIDNEIKKKPHMGKPKSRLILVTFLLFGILSFGQTGKVIKIKDGDTVVILDKENVQHTIRVADVDCPEKNQPFGKKAKWFVSEEIFGKNVKVEPKNPSDPEDKYGRIIGYIKYENKDLGQELLKGGLAWHYKYYSKDKYLSELEKTAKQNKKGLWIDPNPINPYQWRKGKRN